MQIDKAMHQPDSKYFYNTPKNITHNHFPQEAVTEGRLSPPDDP